MRNLRMPVLAAVLTAAALGATTAATADQTPARDYVVVYKPGASAQDARAAIAKAGGKVIDENAAIGVATVRSQEGTFASQAAGQKALEGAAPNTAIGFAPHDQVRKNDVERPGWLSGGGAAKASSAKYKAQRAAKAQAQPDPLSGLQWDMQMIGATTSGSYARQQGTRGVRVGIIDTGVDGTHPDIAPNFDTALSRNFTIDDPVIDGACDTDPDKSCNDPANTDENGHGTHVAGTIGAALNGIGMAGVAPKVDLVNIRAGQDSGYFFLGPTLDALTYAGDNGIDVVNMSFYIDPWLYNCTANAADSPQEQRDQKLIIEATQRAIDYARSKGVTTIAAAGNEFTDLGHPTADDTSPDYPNQTTSPHHRAVDNSCLSVPTETNGVIAVSALGRSVNAQPGRKSYYSNYGVEQTDVSAPGGDSRVTNPAAGTPSDEILAPMPLALAQASGLNPDGTPKSAFVVSDCHTGTCAYYQYLQGTSMASPHAVGVAALAVAQYGKRDKENGGLTLNPNRVEQLLRGTATKTPCPNPPTVTYHAPQYTATCEGTPQHNGFYGDGVVSASGIISR
jgi:lantibiotic leader peptide-processing serine protease